MFPIFLNSFAKPQNLISDKRSCGCDMYRLASEWKWRELLYQPDEARANCVRNAPFHIQRNELSTTSQNSLLYPNDSSLRSCSNKFPQKTQPRTTAVWVRHSRHKDILQLQNDIFFPFLYPVVTTAYKWMLSNIIKWHARNSRNQT